MSLLLRWARGLLVLCLLGWAAAGTAIEPVRVAGAKFVVSGREVRLRGVNLGNWLLREDFMLGLYGTHSQMATAMGQAVGLEKAAAFWDEYERVYFTEDDAKFLKARGFNLLRVPINQNRLEDPNRPGVYDEAALRRLDDMVRISGQNGLWVMLDLHAVPGGQSREIYADSPAGANDFWRYADMRARATDLWVALARRYRHEQAVMGYDLINEPNTEGHTALLSEWLRTTLARVRAVDPDKPVVLSGDEWGKGFLGLDASLWRDPQTVFQFHIYPSFTYPWASMTTYPATLDGVTYDRAWLRLRLAEQLAFKRRPVLLGEFGFTTGRRDDLFAPMIRDFLKVADEAGWSWAQWSYKDVGRMGLIAPSDNTPWRRFLASQEVAGVLATVDPLLPLSLPADDRGGMPKVLGTLTAGADQTTRRAYLVRAASAGRGGHAGHPHAAQGQKRGGDPPACALVRVRELPPQWTAARHLRSHARSSGTAAKRPVPVRAGALPPTFRSSRT